MNEINDEVLIARKYEELKRNLKDSNHPLSGMLGDNWRDTVKILFGQWRKALTEAENWEKRRYSQNDRLIDVYDSKTGKKIKMRADEANERKRLRMIAVNKRKAEQLSRFTYAMLVNISPTEQTRDIVFTYKNSLSK